MIGAGLAGLTAAQALHRTGLAVLVLEKSRGVGGRMATRRIATPQGMISVDHGAQYFTARSHPFKDFLTPLINTGQVTAWIDSIPTLTATGIVAATEPYIYPRYCCPEGMTALAKNLAQDLTIRFDTRATEIYLTPDSCWEVNTTKSKFQAKAVVLTAPVPQSLDIIGPLSAHITGLNPADPVRFDPCLAVMVGYDRELAPLPQGLRWEDPIIAWSALDSSKRPGSTAPVLVFHTTPQFARDQALATPQAVITQVLAQASARLGCDLEQPLWAQTHFWRYAQPINPLSLGWVGTVLPAPLMLVGCWCNEGRVEGAYLSGLDCAQEFLRSGWLS